MCRKFSLMVLVAVFVAAPAFARDTTKELTVNLRFAPQEGVETNSPDLTEGMLERAVTLRFEDGRGDDALEIGQGTNDDDQRFPIRASTDVLAFVRDTLTQVGADWDVKIEDPADRVLTIRLTRFHVDESNKALGSMYASEVKMTFALADKGGKRLMDGAASGSANRYGRARSGDNCNEVLSDALKEAYANLLSDSRLQDAWVSGKASGGSSGSGAAKPESVEERLRKLDDLLKKGLITKDEYDKKRAEILKDV